MKKIFSRNKTSVSNKIIETLRDENEKLNAEITKIKIQMKNNVDSAKSILLEENLNNYEKELIQLKIENNNLKTQNDNLSKENKSLKLQIAELQAMIDEAAITKE